jgi:hypothetical protein
VARNFELNVTQAHYPGPRGLYSASNAESLLVTVSGSESDSESDCQTRTPGAQQLEFRFRRLSPPSGPLGSHGRIYVTAKDDSDSFTH